MKGLGWFEGDCNRNDSAIVSMSVLVSQLMSCNWHFSHVMRGKLRLARPLPLCDSKIVASVARESRLFHLCRSCDLLLA